MRLAWLPQNLRSSLRTRRRHSGNRLRVRQLERRRVLAASVTDIFFAPADLDGGTAAHDSDEGTQITATANASGTGPLTYGWQLSQGDTVITQSTGTSFVFTPPDDGVYTVSLKVTDSAQTAASHSEEIIVHNVAPQLTNVVGDTINESQTADIFVTIVDPGALDVFEIDVDWKDGDPIDTITGLGSTDTSGVEGNTAYEWTAATRQLKLSHQYLDDNPTGTASDTYHVTLLARDDEMAASDPVDAEVVVNNVRPVLHVAPDQMVNEGATLDLSGMGAPPLAVFIDPGTEDTHLMRTVDWGDGSPLETPTIFQGVGAAALGATHVYADDGVYEVKVTVTDDDGGMDMQSFFVTVENVPPVLHPAPDQMVNEGQLLDLSGMGAPPLGVFIDPGLLDTHTVTVNWGDGSPTETPTIFPGVGSSALGGTHTYADDGVYEVKITVTDDDGGMDMESFFVTVKNVPPVLHVAPDQMVNEGALLDLSGVGAPPIAVFIDPGLLDTHTVTVNWGDGSAPETPTIFPGVGSSAVGGTHTYADDGVYKVTVTVTDDDGGSDMESFFVTVKNVAPTIDDVEASAASLAEGETFSITAMFSDPGFDNPDNPNPAMPPDIVDPLNESFTYDIDWGDGRDPVTGMSVADMNGGVGMDSTGNFGGSHVYADDGVYTVTLRVHDDNGDTTTYMVMVTVTNVAPTVVVPNGNQMLLEGGTLTLADLATFTDPGFDNGSNPTTPSTGDPFNESFTYDIDWGDGRDPITGMSVADVNGGPGMDSSGTISGSHTYADDGVYTVIVTVHDDNGDSHSQMFTVTVENVKPELVVTPSAVTIDEGGSVSFDAVFSDPGFDNASNPTTPATGDPFNESFTYDIDWGDGRDPITGMSVADANGGVGMDSTGMFSGSHTYADDGTYTVTVTIRDDNGETDVKTFDVVVNNVKPELVVTPSAVTIDEGGSVSFDAVFSDPGFDNASNPTTPSTGDPFNESFTYDIDWGDGRDPITGMSVADLNGGVGMDSTGMFSGNHTYADDGTYTVTVTIRDDNGETDVKTFDVVVSNVRPTLVLTPGATMVNEGSSFGFTAAFSDPGFDNGANPTTPATGDPLNESFRYYVNWGDGREQVPDQGVADMNGGVGMDSTGTFGGTHTYADNGTYTVTVRIADDNMSGDFAGGMADDDFVEMTFTIVVNNVDPTLTGTEGHVVKEGQEFSLSDLGVGIADPGFDNSANTGDPANGGELVEMFEVMRINWGDGTIDDNTDGDASDPITVVDRDSGDVNVLTTAKFSHADHAYADNGTYTITITLKDDDGGFVERQFTIVVENVAPTLTLTSDSFVINEGSTLVIPNLGTFTDPGFNNLLNPNAQPGGSFESFSYTINWGDGTPNTVVDVPAADVSNGAQGILTTGAIANSHFYADNDEDNTYTITVTLTDDDGDSDVETFDITVHNVNPTLFPVAATDIDANTGSTTLTLTFLDPGADEFEIFVDWGDRLGEPNPAERFVVAGTYDGTTPQTFIITHVYAGPPDPDNPTADIVITVKIRDDDFQTLGVIQPGESNLEVVAISNPGIQTTNVAIDTTPDVPRLDLTVPPTAAVYIADQAAASQVLQRQDVRGSGGEVAATTERYLELRLVYPDGTESEGFRISDDALLDLRAFFKTLPDGRYRIYLVRSETKVPRLVIEVDVRRGRVVDISDESEGTRDRPPTVETESEAVPLEQNPLLEAVPPEQRQGDGETRRQGEESGDLRVSLSPQLLASLSPLAATAQPWSQRLDRAFAEADDHTARRLRRAGRIRRHLAPLLQR